MAPKLLIPPCFTDSDGTIERVTGEGFGGRERWDSASWAWVPSGAITASVIHGRLLSAEELAKAGIPTD